MEQEYAATYYSKAGKAIIHVVAPLPVSEEERQRSLYEFYQAVWAAWNLLSVEERLKTNSEYDNR